MIAISLQSGSNGNCTYVEACGVRLLFDAGVGGRETAGRLAKHGLNVRDVTALIISHEHADHVRCAGVLHRMYGMPVYMTRGTLGEVRHRLGPVGQGHHFRAGDTLQFGPVRVETLPTPHDGVDGVAFVVAAAGRRLGILTDLGHVFGDLEDVLPSLDAVFIESNYDEDMLASGPYPPYLKDRIRGPGGHISNVESARLMHDCAGSRLRWACLAHLSEINNEPPLALATHRRIWAKGFPLHVASRYACVGPFEV